MKAVLTKGERLTTFGTNAWDGNLLFVYVQTEGSDISVHINGNRYFETFNWYSNDFIN